VNGKHLFLLSSRNDKGRSISPKRSAVLEEGRLMERMI